jgi:amidase
LKTKNAAMVQALIDEGAHLVGKTHLVEMAYALTGRNVHFGTPINPKAPDRLPGGSSSGSAAAVAGGLADIGLSTDTLGSIRVPGSYCGLYGLRPTQGRLSLEGASPLAPSLDTGGWLTRDIETLRLLVQLFLKDAITPLSAPLRLGVPLPLIADLESQTRMAFEVWLEVVNATIAPVEPLDLAHEDIVTWTHTVRIIQGYEAWKAHGSMILKLKPELGPGIIERFEWASKVSLNEYQQALEDREVLYLRLAPLIKSHVLILPSAPGPAPLRSASDAELEGHRTALIRQMSLASLFGLPELTLPLLTTEGLPVGISLIGPRGGDLALAELASKIVRETSSPKIGLCHP